tara:strand:+ start:14629 stop:15486 length:858 start_codon:yes stop_codon:yes gene_type:complete
MEQLINKKIIDQAHGSSIVINNVSKIYDPNGARVVALDGFSLNIKEGEFVAIVGPSGCGKSTLLNILAGFDTLTNGEVYIDGKLAASQDKALKPGSDRVVVFQNGSLFPWMTVLENVSYGLIKSGKYSKDEANNVATSLLSSSNLNDIALSYPSQLSSGMQRRVEILRALINNPSVLLLDEPFRAMDTVSKSLMHQHLLDIYDKYKKTIFFITHDLEEAIYLADTVVVMTTRPGTLKVTLDVNIARPRNKKSLLTENYKNLKRQAIASVHEEAKKAFERGERELA